MFQSPDVSFLYEEIMVLAMSFLGKKELKALKGWNRSLHSQMSMNGMLGDVQGESFYSSIWKETISDWTVYFSDKLLRGD